MGTLTYFSQGFEEDKWSKVCKRLAQCLTPGVSSVLTLCPCPLIKCYLCWFVSLLRGFPWSGTGVTGILLILGMCYIVWSHRPVPELPGKSTFFGSSDEFIEKRRQGLQHFLEKWVDLAGWHLPPGGDGRGVCAVQNGPGAYRHVCVRCFSCPCAFSTHSGRKAFRGRGWARLLWGEMLSLLPVFAPGSCRVWSSCQTASYTSSCKASSQCLK